MGYRYRQFVSIYIRGRDDFRWRAGVKNRLGASKRRCQQKKHWMTPRGLLLGPHRFFFFRVLHKSCGSSGFSPPGVHSAPGLRCRRYAGLGGHSGRIVGISGGGSRTRVCGSACRSRRWRPDSGGSHRSAYRRFNQCGGGAASRSRGCQRGMVVKAAGCAGQGILILAWLETRDHFNPFALRASEDFPVDVDRPT